jgi:hypothetical protein
MGEFIEKLLLSSFESWQGDQWDWFRTLYHLWSELLSSGKDLYKFIWGFQNKIWNFKAEEEVVEVSEAIEAAVEGNFKTTTNQVIII